MQTALLEKVVIFASVFINQVRLGTQFLVNYNYLRRYTLKHFQFFLTRRYQSVTQFHKGPWQGSTQKIIDHLIWIKKDHIIEIKMIMIQTKNLDHHQLDMIRILIQEKKSDQKLNIKCFWFLELPVEKAVLVIIKLFRSFLIRNLQPQWGIIQRVSFLIRRHERRAGFGQRNMYDITTPDQKNPYNCPIVVYF